MNDTLISFLLMGSAIIVMGALLGLQVMKIEPKGMLRFPDSSFVWVFIYYVGALMHGGYGGNGLGQCFAYAFLTVVFGSVLTMASAAFWSTIFLFLGIRTSGGHSEVVHN